MSGERQQCLQGALPLAALNLVLSGHTEEVYNFGRRLSEVSTYADTSGTEHSPPDGMILMHTDVYG